MDNFRIFYGATYEKNIKNITGPLTNPQYKNYIT